jgi:RNA polymerase sigma-70 factor, ECF subfamily
VETFWRIYRARARFDPASDFGGWAYRIAANLALSHLRRRSPEQELHAETLQSTAPQADPAVQGQQREEIRRAFSRLPARLQVAVTMALIEERPYQEIAEVLGIPAGTVKSRVFRAVRLLRKQLYRTRVRT